MITSTAYVAPVAAVVAPVSVAPTSAAAPVCVPCTSYVTQTVNPPAVCTTMIFCDVADQSENCISQNNRMIESIASRALRSGGNVFINGQRVVFEVSASASASASVSVISGSSVATITGLDANAAPGSLVNVLAGSAAALVGMIFLL